VLLLASGARAQAFAPSVLVSGDTATTTIDLCASQGVNLRFGWDYDNDGRDDQRGPCRRTVEQDGPIHVTIWEAGGGGRHEETVWPRGSAFDPVVTVSGTGLLGLGAVADPATYTVSTCSSAGRDLETSFALEGSGELVVDGCTATVRLFNQPDTAVLSVTLRSRDQTHEELVPLRVAGLYTNLD
jgi:hypothetical protein